MVAAAGARDRNLGEGVSVRENLVDEHLSEPTTGYLDGGRLYAGFLEVWTAFSDDGHQRTLGHVWSPNGKTDQTVWSSTAFLERQRVLNKVVR